MIQVIQEEAGRQDRKILTTWNHRKQRQEEKSLSQLTDDEISLMTDLLNTSACIIILDFSYLIFKVRPHSVPDCVQEQMCFHWHNFAVMFFNTHFW